MAAKKVLLLLSSDRYAYPLFRYLTSEGKRYGWKITIGSMFDDSINDRLKAENVGTDLKFICVNKYQQADQAIRKSDLVIGIMPDVLLLQVADSCIAHRTALISPSRLNRQMALKRSLAEENKVLLLMDCGFSPGLDHVTAKKAIDNIHAKGGKISSFKTSSGNLVAETNIDNPLGFKLTEPASELISFGKQNNRHLIHGQLQHIPYHRLFERSEPVDVLDLKDMVVIPEGDALYYRKIYGIPEAGSVAKGKLVKKGFDHFWNLVVKLGMTDNLQRIDLCTGKSFCHFLDSLLPYSPTESLELRLQKYAGADDEDIEKLKWLGWFGSDWMEGYKELTPAIIFQHLLERKLTPRPEDMDAILMKHDLEYAFRGEYYKFTATFVLESESQQDSALAKSIGFMTGAAAKLFLLGNISLKGLQIPVTPAVYEPILNELDDLGIAFHVEDKKVSNVEINAPV